MYIINKTDGTIAATVNEGVVNSTSTDLTLIGKNYAVYGELIAENFVKLLENFSYSSPPTNPITGQLWYNTTNGKLLVYNGIEFRNIINTSIESATPENSAAGDFWYDTTVKQLKFYVNNIWNVVAPAYTEVQQLSGILVETVNDSSGNPQVITSIYDANIRMAIISANAFTPSTTITGYGAIASGLNIKNGSTISGVDYLPTDTDGETTGTLSILNDNGLIIGANLDLSITVDSNSVDISSDIESNELNFFITASNSSPLLGLTIDSVGDTVVQNDLYANNAVLDGNLTVTGDILPDIHLISNIGSPSSSFDTVYAVTFYGTSVLSQYADIAENYQADAFYEPGTVVDFGGDEEVTLSTIDSSPSIAGIITHNPAHLMNTKLTGEFVAPVALLGRVPCKVIGKIYKGQMLVSAGNGFARAELSPVMGTVIGKALENHQGEQGIIEVVVGRI